LGEPRNHGYVIGIGKRLFKSVKTGFGTHTASLSIDSGAVSPDVKAAMEHS